ncbi:hypothetical protein [Streptomonospora wellingtoniae]|uniref:Uncharacterized protein n=1 Tax=Streptomonospora wellingtoniae TaxID=3075544 RepID=A0ABU2L142_9ACTN|nr:hypothetical protein [Streptomonospora sp. DSM 45055]MDT0305279.1 hypothetical protein [Streptomonospora sp. DSM 45055]
MADIHGVAVRLRRVQREADECDAALVGLERAHADLQRRVADAEVELEALRQQRLDAFEHFWVTREQRDRARHLSRRLRRRLHRLHRRTRVFDGLIGD